MGTWASETFAGLSLEEKVGQAICYRASKWREDTVDLARKGLMGACSPGYYQGMRTLEALVGFMNELLEAAPIPPFFISSHASARPELGATPFPGENSSMIFGAAGDPDLARECARLVSLESKAMGYDMVWEPCVDVNTEPRNPIIGTRSYSDRAELVAEMAAAVVAGMQESRVIPNAKHYPGHGDTAFDTHVQIGTVPHERARLDAVELYPYKQLVQEGLRGIMTAHLIFPALDPDTRLPATFSRKALYDVLRGELGYTGLIVSDSLTMKAIKDNFSVAEAAVMAFNAGHDIILQDYNEPPEPTLEALVQAVQDGRIPMEELDASVMRILEAKEWCGLHRRAHIDLQDVRRLFCNEAHMAVMEDAYQAGVTLLEASAAAPQAEEKTCLIYTVPPEEGRALEDMEQTVETSCGVFFGQCEGRLGETVRHMLPEDPTEEDVSAAMQASADCDSVIFATTPRIVCYKELSGAVGQGQPQLVQQLLDGGKTVNLCVFGNPFVLADFPKPQRCLTTYSSRIPAVRAGLSVLFGESVAPGRLPVTIPDRYEFGHGL